MQETLLKTKLYIPPARPELVARPRLIELLNNGLRKKLTLISAPPGFGKTTLLSEWINSEVGSKEYGVGEEHQDTLTPDSLLHTPKVAWLSLDEQDNDPVRFWTYAINALEAIQKNVGTDALTLLHAPQAPPIETTLTTLINALTTIPHHFVLILDDYHVLSNKSIHQGLAFLLDHLPPQMHLIITSRVDLPLPLNRLRVRNQLTEIRDADLRFRLEEAVTFLNQVMHLNLSPDDIIALENRTEGWIAGLQLAALSMQGHADTSGFVHDFTGSHRYIIDYLAEEVLARQPEAVQQFLLQTSILERMCGPLCDTLVSDFRFQVSGYQPDPKPEPRLSPRGGNLKSVENSQEMLEYLETANLFLIPLDDERRWYRYHHLFADFLRQHLRQELGQENVDRLHRRASQWFEANGLMTEAIWHSLAANNHKEAARLVESAIIDALAGGEVTSVTGWLDALPEALVRTRPRLALGQAWALVIFNRWDQLEPWVQDIERELAALEADQNQDKAALQSMKGELAALKALLASNQGQAEQAIQLCLEALERLPKDSLTVHTIILMTLGGAYETAGDFNRAIHTLTEALAMSKAIAGITILLPIVNNLGRIQEELGQLHRAAEFYREALEFIEEQAEKRGRPGQPLLISGWTYLSIAEILREWNNLEAAQNYLTIGSQLTQQLNALGNTTAIGQLILARILQAQGDEAGALQTIERAQQTITPNSPISLWIEAIQARLWLAQGNVEAASRWAQECALPLDKNFRYPHYPGEYTTLVRVFIAQEQFDEALALLKRMQTIIEPTGRKGRLLEIVMLQALALYAQGNSEQALAPLSRAISLGEPGGYVRLFVDEGLPMAQLLTLAQAKKSMPNQAYIQRLLAAFGSDLPTDRAAAKQGQPPANAELMEPLSERELEVLQLVAEGLSNRDIAEKLFITVGTAKTHTINIYRKLDVRSRTQAVARATELGLL